MKPSITVVIPVRISSHRKDIFDRLEFCFVACSNDIEILVVDDGSELSDQIPLKQRCQQLGFHYISTGASSSSPFNLSRARNYAAIEAKGQYLFFMDVDLLPYPEFFDDLKREIEINKLEETIDAFLMIPVVYLNELGLAKYHSEPAHLKKHFSSNILINGCSGLIEKYSFGTSCILVNRFYYLSIGGQDESFEGWGYEDYEFTSRIMRLYNYYPKPTSYESMAGNFMKIKKYEGWKSEYRLFGLSMAMKNIYLIHAPHMIDENYKRDHKKNLKLFEKSLKIDWQRSLIKNILPHSHRSLLLSKNPFCYSYKLNGILGQVDFLPPDKYSNHWDVLSYFHKQNLTQIVLPNPYGNDIYRNLYNYCRKEGVPYLVCERGALPDSTFLDPHGFLCDSDSYLPKYWDQELTSEEDFQITEYLSQLSEGKRTLERQTERSCKQEILKHFAIPDDAIKIAVILQTENDTVIKFFGREFKSLDLVKKFVLNAIEESNRPLHFIYKNHPLEPNPVTITKAINAGDMHINDLIEVCDCVLTVNSGAGLIAALLGKPVFTLGDSWYSQEGIAQAVRSVKQFNDSVENFKPDREKVHRFAHYLRFKFYSMGKQHTKIHKKDGSIINATLWIDYEEVQSQEFGRLFFKRHDEKIGSDSLLFKFYDSSSLCFNNEIPYSQQDIRRKKLRKLRERPFSFIFDAIKNKLKL